MTYLFPQEWVRKNRKKLNLNTGEPFFLDPLTEMDFYMKFGDYNFNMIWLNYVKNPSEEKLTEIITKNVNYIYYVKNLTPKLITLAIKKGCKLSAVKRHNFTKKAQIAAIEANPNSALYITNPCNKVVNIIRKKYQIDLSDDSIPKLLFLDINYPQF